MRGALFKILHIAYVFTGPRSACHSAESLFVGYNVYEHNSLGSSGKYVYVSSGCLFATYWLTRRVILVKYLFQSPCHTTYVVDLPRGLVKRQ